MTTPKNRKRNSLSLLEEGKEIVNNAMFMRPWTQQRWADEIGISLSTLKRFLRGTKIDASYFYDACIALDLIPANLIAPRNNQLDNATILLPQQVSLPSDPSPTQNRGIPLGSFMITGTFSPNKLAEIEVALAHLEHLLRDNCTITLVPDQNSLAVTGKFSKDQKPQIDVAIMHIEKLLLEHYITSDKSSSYPQGE
ncbi:MAG: hypothetical protein P2A85_28410 [Microcoleus anatoxicus]|uniref:hypothetical protein n=1 Tax=Microcoleus anatoxicus TaxID=2705319 RepID=UPI00366D8C7E